MEIYVIAPGVWRLNSRDPEKLALEMWKRFCAVPTGSDTYAPIDDNVTVYDIADNGDHFVIIECEYEPIEPDEPDKPDESGTMYCVDFTSPENPYYREKVKAENPNVCIIWC